MNCANCKKEMPPNTVGDNLLSRLKMDPTAVVFCSTKCVDEWDQAEEDHNNAFTPLNLPHGAL